MSTKKNNPNPSLWIDWMDIDAIPFAPLNPKKHDLDGIGAAIKRYGMVETPTLNETTGRLVVGHGRIETLRDLKRRGVAVPKNVRAVDGHWFAPVLRGNAFASDTEAAAYLVDANALTLAGSDLDVLQAAAIWDQDGYANLLAGLANDNALPVSVGLDDYDALLAEWNLKAEIDEPTAATEELVDHAAELQAKWQVRRGDVWEVESRSVPGGAHRLVCGDSTDTASVQILMQGEGGRLLFTSPPYSDMRTYRGGKNLDVDYLSNFIFVYAPYADFQVINLGIKRREREIDPYWNIYIKKAQQAGYLFLSWNVWNRSGLGGSLGNITAFFPIEHEWLFVFGKDFDKSRVNKTVKNKHAGAHRKNLGDRLPDGKIARKDDVAINPFRAIGTVQSIDFVRGVEEKRNHPAGFPVSLPSEFIGALTQPGEVVVDSFGGSGTTLVACENMGRVGRAMELDDAYCAVTLERLSNLGLTLRRVKEEG